MLIVTREMLTAHLLALPSVMDLYADRSPDFVGAATAWLATGEELLARLRNPLVSLLAAERAKITASQDGYRDPNARAQTPPRKMARVVAAQSLAHVEMELRAVVTGIDARLAPLRDKTAQLIAVASSSQPIPLQGDTPRDAWLLDIWAILKQSNEGRSMAAYLAGSLAPGDRQVVLGETLDNLLGHVG